MAMVVVVVVAMSHSEVWQKRAEFFFGEAGGLYDAVAPRRATNPLKSHSFYPPLLHT